MKFRAVCIAVLLALACALLGGCAQGTGKSARTLFIYLCGSNLETKQGLAGKNIDELLEADIPDDTRVIIQTGGAKTWRSHDIANDKLQRYEVRNKQLQLLDELDNASMGSEGTLRDFLAWGAKAYGSKENVLVIWDHGGKSADKVCFDENYGQDALTRSELGSALKDAELPFTFDLVVFDACFMSTLENAALMSDYAKYLVASQEVVPSSGMDYTALVQDMSRLDAKDLGTSICDAYIKKCESKKKEDSTELSLMDLSQTEKTVQVLDAMCQKLAAAQEAKDGAFKLLSTTKASAIYGMKNLTNLFDLQSFLSTVEDLDPTIDVKEVISQKNKFVAYTRSGDKTATMGVSLYYPFEYDRTELQAYLETCPIKGYADLLKRIYDNLPAQMLAFADKGSISEGDFQVALTPESARYLASITYTLSRQDPKNADNYILMGTDCNIKQDWDNLTFRSDFYPTWPSLWGEHLLTSVNLMTPHTVAFSAPVNVEGEKTDLIAVYKFGDNYREGSYAECALWGGVDSNGVPSRDYKILEAGNKVAAYAATGSNRDDVVLQDTVTIPDGVSDEEANQVKETPLPDGRYRLQFVVTDIVGNNLTSDYGIFEVAGGQSRLVEVQS